MIAKQLLILSYYILFLMSPVHSICQKMNDPWHRVQQNNIEIICKEKDIKNSQNLIDFIDNEFKAISSDLGFIPQNIQVIIAPTKTNFKQVTGNNLPEWSSGAAIPARNLILLQSPRIVNPDVDIKKIILHELTHIGLYQATGGQDLMKWFDEGFAQYYSGELNMNTKILMAKRLLTDTFLSLKEIDDLNSLPDSDVSLAYAEAHTAVIYLIELGGITALQNLIDSLKRTGNMDQAMQASLGMGFNEFQIKWLASVKKHYLWLVLFDYRLLISILFVVLFISAYLVKRKNTRKIKKEWEKEDIENFKET